MMNMEWSILPGYAREEEIRQLFTEYTDMVLAGDPAFAGYLARQHYENLAPLFEKFGLRCALLTGSTKARERRDILENLALGSIDLCIGTHALLTEDVSYARLGLVITDEQHRFGVNQRAARRRKIPTCWCCPPRLFPGPWR